MYTGFALSMCALRCCRWCVDVCVVEVVRAELIRGIGQKAVTLFSRVTY